ncbi:hypothetical protein NDU88_011432 [Pleurodeles waltl]|uniref:Forkhead box protein G1 n=1 Tax=Pleurodeles waltl TaxID=8319 RepID=A0AAV7QYR8_PLEWA|nr:hypothetical protein NDU88_011432 [Pleurodeles waltl]
MSEPSNASLAEEPSKDLAGDRPPYSYVAMIAMAIEESPERRLSLSDIYAEIARRFPYYARRSPRGWQNSVRHNLSLNACFVKEPPGGHGPARGHLWAVDPAYRDMFDKGNYRRRRRAKRPRPGPPSSAGSGAPSLRGYYPAFATRPSYPPSTKELYLEPSSIKVPYPASHKVPSSVPPHATDLSLASTKSPYMPPCPYPAAFLHPEASYLLHPGPGPAYHLLGNTWGSTPISPVNPQSLHLAPMYPHSQAYGSFHGLRGLAPLVCAGRYSPGEAGGYPPEGPSLHFWEQESQHGPFYPSAIETEGTGPNYTTPSEEADDLSGGTCS